MTRRAPELKISTTTAALSIIGAAQQVSTDAGKSARLADVAKGVAKLHLYKQARETANLCASSRDKLAAYTAILREYHIERHPDQAKLFEEEKPE